jgi:alanyl-tRNA synthetase
VVQFVCDATPFYGEQGGQIGDQGTASGPGLSLRVTDTQKPSDLTVHVAEIVTGELRVGQSLELVVDAERRAAIRRNHSATHLLHLALRSVLGEHVAQKGSLVAPDRLRFDFSHFAPLSAAERARIEALVNERILLNVGVVSEELALEEAKKKGAIAFFGDKYGDRVRVIEMHDSMELCGGTHVTRTGDIGFFKITTEGGVAQGVRRLEAVTGDGARGYVAELERELLGAASLLRAPAFQVVDRVEKLQKELRERDKAIEDLKAKLAGGGARDLMASVRDVGGIKVLAARTEVGDPKALREVGDQLRDKLGSGVVVLGGVDGDKVALVALVTKDLVGKVKAGDIVKALSAAVGGKGGGRPDMAQGGGTDAGKLDEALELTYAIVAAAV